MLPILLSCAAVSVHGFSFREAVSNASSPAWRLASADTAAKEMPEKWWTAEELKTVIGEQTEPALEGTKWQRHKNAKVAMLCALLVPGLGQLYNEKGLKAGIAMGIETFYLSKILVNSKNAARAKNNRDALDEYIPYETAEGDTVWVLNQEWQSYDWWYEEYNERVKDWVWWSAATLFIIVIDAYIDAHLHDMRFKIEAAPADKKISMSYNFRF